MKVNIIQTAGNCFRVELIGVETGKIAALKHALDKYSEESTVALDIKVALDNAIKQNDELAGIVK